MASNQTSSSSSSSSSSAAPMRKFDVFLSFRGEDTRRGFTGHLYAALNQRYIHTFMDDGKLEKGKTIAPELLKAIEESKIAVVIISRNYASSTWCLEELLKIFECHNKSDENNGERITVFPVFYQVDPSHVRKQTGVFEEAFAEHDKVFKDHVGKVKLWKEALTQVASIVGWDLGLRPEHEVINEIVEKISCLLNRTSSSTNKKDLVGVDSRIDKLLSFMELGKSNEVLTIGIWGMGGIGKTTLAQEILGKIRHQFDAFCFVRNVREESEKHNGLAQLRKDLYNCLLGYNCDYFSSVGNNYNRLCYKKVLIILDDVDQSKQIETLVGNYDEQHELFGPGSRIIVTTRNAHLLKRFGENNIYEVGKLDEEEAIKLFSRKAFRMDHPTNGYKDKSIEVVKYANGLPLALEVLGSFLYGRNIEAWSSTLSRLKEHPNEDIVGPLQVSFDGLKRTEKAMFLDIACFFRGEEKCRVIKILGASDYSPLIDIDVLVEKSLVTYVGDKLWMHDLLQELGWDIVSRESPKQPGNRSRLWLQQDILNVLEENKGTEAVEGMFLRLPKTEQELNLNVDPFSKMCCMRLLKICNVKFSRCVIGSLSKELRLLEWHGYPLKSLPTSFQPRKLVELNLSNSRIEKILWRENMVSERLMMINLSNCQYLTKIPNFNTTPNLEKLILRGCKRLSMIHPSVGVLKKLVLLNLKGCESLQILCKEMELESLETLILSGCSKLSKFPEIVGNMKELTQLYLDGTAIVELPKSIKCLSSLTLLNLKDCKNLLTLPNIICSLTTLTNLNISGCSCLDQLPENLGNLECLEELDASETAIREVPSSISLLKNLKHLSFRGCSGMPNKSWLLNLCNCLFAVEGSEPVGLMLPNSFSGLLSLKSLDLSKCSIQEGAVPDDLWQLCSLEELDLSENNFRSMPDSICQLSELRELRLNRCSKLESLPKLPLSVKHVNARYCAALETSNEHTIWISSKGLCVIDCQKLNEEKECKGYKIPTSNKHVVPLLHTSCEDHVYRGNEFTHFFPHTTIPDWCSNSSTGSSVTIQLPPDLEHNNMWMGLALCIVFEVQTRVNTNSTVLPAICRFYTDEDCMEISLGQFNDKEYITSEESYGVCKYIPRKRFDGHLDKASRVEVSISLNSTCISVKMCGAHLIYKQDVTKFVRDLFPIDDVQDYFNHCQDIVDRVTKTIPVGEVESIITDRRIIDMMESAEQEHKGTFSELSDEAESKFTSPNRFLLHVDSTDSTISIAKQGWRSFSTMELRSKLQLSLSRLFQESYAGYLDFGCIFPLKAILPWFTYQCVGRHAFCCLTPNLLEDKKWLGFALYVVFRSRLPFSLNNLDSESSASVVAHLHIKPGGMLHSTRFSLKNDNLVGSEHRLVLLYVPCVHFPKVLHQCGQINALFATSNSDYLEIEICGIRKVYENDMKDLIQTIIECTIESPNVHHEQYCKTFGDMGNKILDEVDIPSEEKDFNLGYCYSKLPREHKILHRQVQEVDYNSNFSNSQSQLPTENGKDITQHFIQKYYQSFNQLLKYNYCFPPSEIPKLFHHQNNDYSIKIQILPEESNWIGLALWAYFSAEESLTGKVDENQESAYSHFLNCYLETDEGSLEPIHSYRITNEEIKWLPHLGGFIWLSYIPCGSLSDQFISFIEASFGSERPGLLVNNCGIQLVYDQQEFEQMILHCMNAFFEDWDLMQESLVENNSVLDVSPSSIDSESEPTYIVLDITAETALLESHSTAEWINNLEKFLSKYFKVSLVVMLSLAGHTISFLRSFDPYFRFNFCFPRKNVLEWFKYQTDRPKVIFQIPRDLYDDKNWMGFVMCAAFTVHEHPAAILDNLCSEMDVHLMCHFILDQENCLMPAPIFRISKEKFKWLNLRGFIWLTYIPKNAFTEYLNEVSYVQAEMHSFDCPGLEVERCGMRLLYQDDVQEFQQTIIKCVTSFFDDLDPICQFLKDKNKEKSPDFDDSYIVPRNQRTDIELLVIEFHRHSIYNSCFTATEILEWFRNYNTGCPSVKIELPTTLLFDDNWIGLALCACFSDLDYKHPNACSIDHLDNTRQCSHRLICHLQTERGSLEHLHVHQTTNEEFIYLDQQGQFIWLSYIPKGWFSNQQLNGCSLLEASFVSDSGRSLHVEKCGLRLLFRHDEDEFKESIAYCMKSLSQNEDFVCLSNKSKTKMYSNGTIGCEAGTSINSCSIPKVDPNSETSRGPNPTSIKGKEKLVFE
ncbi:hypothetical protein F8388_006035 [Cannabis sativa]|uniref:ADP-ribosyl cyclase/cyclic ADP-ribose hydrolase n=1 Tax=Cannabis sativa TaxID=3483 RepID=A0A7J6ICD9_CANSA|nr:hypothetical protein F8388_006035 [Cannabis sativa]KAF4404709.1 hypothetical protein G4B88_006095 [Cannabis sativa]